MKMIASLIFVIFIFSGCSSTYQINSPSDAKNRLEERSGYLLSTENVEYEADNIHIQGDSASFIDNHVNMSKTIALRDISIIKSTNHSAGARRGILIGAGTVLGILAVAIAFPSESKKNSESTTSLGSQIEIFGGLSIFGGLLGGLGGGIIGIHETYVFNQKYDNTKSK